MRSRKGLRSCRGVTLVETLVSLFLVGVLGVLAFEVIIGTAKTNAFLEAHNDLGTMSQRALNQIKDNLNQSRRILDRSVDGVAYQQKLDLGSCPPPISTSLLPLIEENGSLSPGANSFVPTSVGNSLLFAQGEPVFEELGTETRLDIYSFHYYYLTQNTKRTIGRKLGHLELLEWRSVYYADASQLLALPELERNAVVAALRGASIENAWNPSEPAASAFFELNSGSSVTPQDPSYRIEMEECRSTMPEFQSGRIGGGMVYSVAYNTGGDFDLPIDVPEFAPSSGAGEGFPNGFEVAVVGTSGGRRVYMRLVLASSTSSFRRNLIAGQNALLVQARDF